MRLLLIALKGLDDSPDIMHTFKMWVDDVHNRYYLLTLNYQYNIEGVILLVMHFESFLHLRAPKITLEIILDSSPSIRIMCMLK